VRMPLLRVALVLSLVANCALGYFAVHIIRREELLDRWAVRFGLRTPPVDRTRDRGYLRLKSVYESMPRIDDSIVFIGDSLTRGSDWSEMFQSLQIRNRGIGNDCAEGVLARLDEILSPPPKKIFFQVGLSDLGRSYRPDEIFQHYERIIDTCRARAPGVAIFVQSVLPMNEALAPPGHEETLRFNERLRTFAERKGCVYIDLYPLFADQRGDLDASLTNDGVHLNGKGYAIWKKAIERYVQ
jgi:lysophospholipase L1-like esterase